MKKPILILAFLILIPQLVHAKWFDQNTWQYNNLNITRPSDRWRVVQNPETGETEIKYLRRGKDIVVRIYQKPRFHKRTSKDWIRNKLWLKQFKKRLLKDYHDQGFRFAEFQLKDNRVFAQGVNKDRQYLLLEFLFKKPGYSSDITVVEMILDDKDYLKYRDAFFHVTRLHPY